MPDTMKNPIGWVEIPVSDLDRAENFYSSLFGFNLDRQEEKEGFTMSWFPMEMESYGAAGTLIKGEGYTPSHDGTLVYFTAPEGSIDKGIEKAQELGVNVLMPKMDIGEHGYIAMLEDTEGNRIAIHAMEDKSKDC